MGKTSLALNIAENAALGLHGDPFRWRFLVWKCLVSSW